MHAIILATGIGRRLEQHYIVGYAADTSCRQRHVIGSAECTLVGLMVMVGIVSVWFAAPGAFTMGGCG